MRNTSTTIRNLWRRARRLCRTRLRSKRATIALLLLIVLMPGESLLCIIHCQLWLPIVFHSYFAAQHQHSHQHNHVHMIAAQPSQPASTARGDAVIAPSAPAAPMGCLMDSGSGSGSAPFHVPPSPVHDMVPVLLLLLLAPLAISRRPAAPPGDPPQVALPPPLRPPIPFAA